MTPTFHFWTDEERRQVAAAALELLERVGVRLDEPHARELLHGAGARVDAERVRIPTPLVETALRSAPRSIAIHDRRGEPCMQLGGQAAHFGAHTDAPDVLDPFDGCRRPCLAADVRRHAALIDALPQLDYTTASGLVADCPPAVADRAALAECLLHSRKPVLAMPVTLQALVDCQTMAALAAGGTAALRDRPLLIVYAEPVSPLAHPDESLRKLLYCAEQGIPLVYTPYAAMGGTAPMSPAAIVAQLCAESLSGLVVHQLARPGAPFIFGGMASLMDMRTTVFSYGAPEFQRGNTLLAEMAHHFRLPNFGTAGTSDAQTFDGQAILEATSSCLMALLVGADLVHDVGLLGNATVVVPEMIVATDEIVAMLRHLLGEVGVEPADLALDVVEQVGPGGEYVTHPHTLRHFRRAWYPQLLYRGGARAWNESPQADYARRVNARTRELLAAPPSAPLPDDAAAAIRALVARAERE